MPKNVHQAAGEAGLKAGIFHRVKTSVDRLEQEAGALALFLDSAISAKGIREKLLLEWFGESKERIVLLAVGLEAGGEPPTHVAREITIEATSGP